MKTLRLEDIEHKCLGCKNIFFEKEDKLPDGIHLNLYDFICEDCIKKVLEKQYNTFSYMRTGIKSKEKKLILESKMIYRFLSAINYDDYLVKMTVFRHYFPIITKDSFLSPISISICRKQLPRENISKELRERIFKKYNYVCFNCGSTERLQIDHIKSVKEGGDIEEDNLQILCKICNLKKGFR